MKPIGLALKEAKKSVLQLALFQSAFDTLVMFLLMLLACLLLSLPKWYAFVPTMIYAIIHTAGNLKDVSFSAIEDKYPQLKEQLITVADNWSEQNEIVEALNQEVLQKMKEIRTSSFLNFGKLSREIIVMALVSILIIGLAGFNVKLIDLRDTLKQMRNFNPEYTVNEELLEYEESQNLDEILGEKNIEELGKQQIDLQINPLMSDVDIGKVNAPEDLSFREVPPTEIRGSSDSSYEEEIPKEYQRMVKKYFKEITRI